MRRGVVNGRVGVRARVYAAVLCENGNGWKMVQRHSKFQPFRYNSIKSNFAFQRPSLHAINTMLCIMVYQCVAYFLLVGEVVLLEWKHSNKLETLCHNVEWLVKRFSHYCNLVRPDLWKCNKRSYTQ